MAYFGFYYPNHTSPTTHWEPLIGPQASTKIDEDDGVFSELAGDGITLWSNIFGPAVDTYHLVFSYLEDSDRASFRTFRDATRGLPFEMLDSISGSYKNVIGFAPSGVSRTWEIAIPFGQRNAGELIVLIAA